MDAVHLLSVGGGVFQQAQSGSGVVGVYKEQVPSVDGDGDGDNITTSLFVQGIKDEFSNISYPVSSEHFEPVQCVPCEEGYGAWF